MRQLRIEPLEDRRLLTAAAEQHAIELFNTSPAVFVENQGQWPDESVRYAFFGSGANVLHTDAGPVFQLFQRDEPPSDPTASDDRLSASHSPLSDPSHPSPFSLPPSTSSRSTSFSVSFVGANTVEPTGLDRAETYYNYFVGGQPCRSRVPTYQTVAYENLYDGVDLYTWGRRDSLKYEFHVAPGADSRQIRVQYEGIDGLSIGEQGELHVSIGDGWPELIDDPPYVYQDIGGQRTAVPSRFVLLDELAYTIDVSGQYDANCGLVIDPELDWATYLGGSGDDWGYAIAADAAGNALVAGATTSSSLEIAGNGSHGSGDAFVAKVLGNGALAWATFLGGTDVDRAFDIAVDSDGSALVTGCTGSNDFEGRNNTYHADWDSFAAKIAPNGSLAWATYLGGSDTDHASGIDVDAGGNALIAGDTASLDFEGAHGAGHGSHDAFLAMVTSAGTLSWVTLVGGTGDDRSFDLATDAAGETVLTGWTRSVDFEGAGNAHLGGESDAFAARVSASGSLTWATYLGGSSDDCGWRIALDAAGNALVTGHTVSPDFEGRNNTGHDVSYSRPDAFVAKVTDEGTLTWATYLGGGGRDYGLGIAVDGASSALVVGQTDSAYFEGRNNANHGGADAFVANVACSGTLVWATYVGGSGFDRGQGIALDAIGNALISGQTDSTDFEGRNNAYHGGGMDAFGARLRISDYGAMVAQYVFYNNSAFDGGNPMANEQDDAAVAADKVPLLPGEKGRFASYTGYSRGINGVMVDLAGLPEGAAPTAADFAFRMGNSDDPSTWVAAALPISVSVRRGEGVNGSDRVTLIWPDYDASDPQHTAVANGWLQVTVLATPNTGLAEPDVFYFGNAIGETGNSFTDAKVNAFDMLGARDNPRDFKDPAPIDFAYDFNRDGRVNATDMLIARDNPTSFLNALKLITVPGTKVARDGGTGVPPYASDYASHDGVAGVPPYASRADGGVLAWLAEFEEAGHAKTRKTEIANGILDLWAVTQ